MSFCKLSTPPHSKLLVGQSLHDTFDSLPNAVENRLREVLPEPESNRLNHAMYTGVLAPGKRTRSVLMMLACKGMGGNAPAVLDLACAVEMVHTASLFMDDMPCMDNAQTRRGQPAAHVQYGQDVAMLAAVALLSEALRLVASIESLSGEIRSQLVVVLSHAVGPQGLAKGQYLDLHNGLHVRDERDISQVNEQKTGVLFAAALEMTALACHAGTTAKTALRAAAIDIGQAFQMRDDLEDGSPPCDGLTKDRNKDAGKSTLVTLLGRDATQRSMQKHLTDAVFHLRAALPHDERMAAFTLRAFGLQVHELDLAAVGAESKQTHTRYVQRWVTG